MPPFSISEEVWINKGADNKELNLQTIFDDALTAEQLAQYEADGCLLVSGLIPEPVAEKAQAVMWHLMEMHPNQPETWTHIPKAAEYLEYRKVVVFYGIQEPDLMACATPKYLLATAQLIGEDVKNLHPPEAIHTQNLFPVIDKKWAMPKAHVDGIPKEHMHPTFPGPYRIASLIYLSDIESRGGGTALIEQR